MKHLSVMPPIPTWHQEKASIHPVILQYLWNRGVVATEHIDAFIKHIPTPNHNMDSSLMRGVAEASRLIISFLEGTWTTAKVTPNIVVFGDYDVDGITSTAFMYMSLKAVVDICGFNASLHPIIPARQNGYGLSVAATDEIISQFVPENTLIITVDNGIKAKEPVKRLREAGFSIIVTDHHMIDDAMFPSDANVVINPQQNECSYDGADLAGCGVAFKFMDGVVNELLNHHYYRDMFLTAGFPTVDSFLSQWLDLIAIGTVADMMSMGSVENRILVHRGIELLRHSPRTGILALCTSAELDKYPIDHSGINTTTIGFGIAPPLNATGRLADANLALKLLITTSDSEATAIASEVHKLNKKRKEMQARYRDIIASSLDDVPPVDKQPVLIQVVKDLTGGISGLLASDLAREYGRPAIILHRDSPDSELWEDGDKIAACGDGILIASCRSVGSFNITDALKSCDDILLGFGGHAQAAGFSISESNLSELERRLAIYAHERISEYEDARQYDMEMPVHAVGYPLWNVVQMLEPLSGDLFGKPTFVSRGLSVSMFRAWGVNSAHLSLDLSDTNGNTLQCNGWYLAEKYDWVDTYSGTVDIAYTLEEAVAYPSRKKIIRAVVVNIAPSHILALANSSGAQFKRPSRPNIRPKLYEAQS